MSMMNANVAATTAMTANKPLDFELPEMGEAEFSNEELAEDMQNTSLYHVNTLLDNARFIVVELCRDA